MPRYPLPVDPTAEIRPFADEDAEINGCPGSSRKSRSPNHEPTNSC
jgi:hypothetical protein